MSIKPLDLQVNMNSQVSLSQQEAERVASLNSQQKANNVKSEDSADLDNNHNIYAEQVTVQEAGQREQTYISTQQEKPQSKQTKRQNTEQTDPLAGRPQHSNSIDFLA